MKHTFMASAGLRSVLPGGFGTKREESVMKTISVRTAAGFRPWRAFVILAAVGTLLAVAAVRDEPKSRELVLVDNLTSNTPGVATRNPHTVTTSTSSGTHHP